MSQLKLLGTAWNDNPPQEGGSTTICRFDVDIHKSSIAL
jgi:hypothetical protein